MTEKEVMYHCPQDIQFEQNFQQPSAKFDNLVQVVNVIKLSFRRQRR